MDRDGQSWTKSGTLCAPRYRVLTDVSILFGTTSRPMTIETLRY
jgi:hypothetical protein